VSHRALALCALLFVWSACSGDSRSSKNDATPDAGGSGGGPVPPDDPSNFACPFDQTCSPIGDRQEPLPPPTCPASEPIEGEACNVEDIECSYGNSATAHCRRYYRCDEGFWHEPAEYRSTCIVQPDDYCPNEPQHGNGCAVGDVDVFVPCGYAGGVTCYCFGNPVGVVGARGSWECYAPPRNGACPELLPNLGDGCGSNGQICHYGSIQQGCYAPYADVYCFQGAWEAAAPQCPL
jgi:hypothetical protein